MDRCNAEGARGLSQVATTPRRSLSQPCGGASTGGASGAASRCSAAKRGKRKRTLGVVYRRESVNAFDWKASLAVKKAAVAVQADTSWTSAEGI